MRSKSRRGYKAAHCSLFISTPQSRLAPCQLPVRGAFLVWCKLKPKAVPAGGESGHERSEWPKGERLGDTKCRDMFPFRHGLRRDTFPVNGDGLNCCPNSAYSAVPLRGAIVSMGLRGSPGGLRGEIEIFPGPLAKKFTLPPVAAAHAALCRDSAARTRAFLL